MAKQKIAARVSILSLKKLPQFSSRLYESGKATQRRTRRTYPKPPSVFSKTSKTKPFTKNNPPSIQIREEEHTHRRRNSVFYQNENKTHPLADLSEIWCSGRDSDPGHRLERPEYLTGLYYRSAPFL